MSKQNGCGCNGKTTIPADLLELSKSLAYQQFVKGRLAVAKDALQDCVSAKIPKLVDEGYSQDQAAAIAYSYCGEKKGVEHGADDDAYAGEEKEAGEGAMDDAYDNDGGSTEGKAMPMGARLAMRFHKMAKDHMDGMEPNHPMTKWLHRTHAAMHKIADDHYGHLDLGIEPLDEMGKEEGEGAEDDAYAGEMKEESEGAEDDAYAGEEEEKEEHFGADDQAYAGEEKRDDGRFDDQAYAGEEKDAGDEDHGDAEAERDDRDGDEYWESEDERVGEGGSVRRRHGGKSVSNLPIVIEKRMSKRHKAAVKEAAEHIHTVAEHEEMPTHFGAGLKYHAAELYRVVREAEHTIDPSSTEGQEELEGRRSAKAAAADDGMAEVYAELAAFREELASVTCRVD